MELKLKKIAASELDSGARMILALKNQPFFFLWYRGEVLMNRNMKEIRKLTSALELMWKHDSMLTQEAMDEADEAYDIIKQTAGGCAADQALDAWRLDAGRSRKAKAKIAALEWIEAGADEIDDASWDILYALGYNSDFINTGLFDAYCDLRDRNPGSSQYKEYFKNWANAAFAYGFHLGRQAVAHRKEAAA